MTIYKYMELKYVQAALEYGAYASKLDEVNDPYERDGIENMDHFRIVCMTRAYKQMLMWSYYVKHKGCCIEFDIPEEYQSIIEGVKYRKFLPDRTEMGIDDIIESLKHKGSEWKYEKEYRAVYYSQRDKKSDKWTENPERREVFLKLPVKAVYFGACSQRDDMYAEALSSIMNYNDRTNNKVKIRKLKISSKKYQLINDEQFDEKLEIERYRNKI